MKLLKIFLTTLLHPLMYLGVKLFKPINTEIIGGKITKNCIYVVNHTNGNDFPTAAQVIKHHFYILADFTMQYDKGVDILNRLNGTVYVDRKSRESRASAKEKLLYVLQNNKNILLFPEGTWNLSPNKLMLPLNWGAIDISIKSQKPIQPIVIHYNENKAYVMIGAPIHPDINNGKGENIGILRDTMSTMMWELLELDPVCKRDNISDDYYDKWLEMQLNTYKKLDLEYETSVIIKEYDTADDVFLHLKRIKPTLYNAFLFNKRNHD